MHKPYAKGRVINVRDFKNHAFIILDTAFVGILQCVVDKTSVLAKPIPVIGSCIEIYGGTKREPKAPNGLELVVSDWDIISTPKVETPIPLMLSPNVESFPPLDFQLNNRAASLRNTHIKTIFQIQACITHVFRQVMGHFRMTEIHTPKIISASSEGGAEVFKLKYFDKTAFLSQSPQLYKQIAAGAMKRVYEIGPVFRAENSQTSRHMTEFTGLDFEMSYIDGLSDIIDTVEYFIHEVLSNLSAYGEEDLKLLGLDTWPMPTPKFPRITFKEAYELVHKHKTVSEDKNLDKSIGEAVELEFDSEFVFVTGYHPAARPFYTMPSLKGDPNSSESFDLLYRGLEICSGAQRIHDYDELVASMKKHNLNPDNYKDYLQAFELGMPPHGGAGIGLERLTQQLLMLDNVKDASMFPRDVNRLTP